MLQLLDRYRRVSDGKEFAVVGLGDLSEPLETTRAITLEAEDGERVESRAPTNGPGRGAPARPQAPFILIED